MSEQKMLLKFSKTKHFMSASNNSKVGSQMRYSSLELAVILGSLVSLVSIPVPQKYLTK